MPELKISVTIITLNEEDRIERTLRSVSGWVDEIIVVDARSSDRTVEICRRYTDRIFIRDWEGYAAAKNFALEKAKNRWILSLDADEVVTPDLKDEIFSLFKPGEPACSGYYIPRMVYYLGKWIRHSSWYPDYQMRLFRKEAGAWQGGSVHESFKLQTDQRSGRLNNHLEHYTYRNLSDHMFRMNQYARLWAEDRHRQGKRGRLGPLFYAPPLMIFKMLVMKRGFLDGSRGILVAMTSGMYVFLKYAYLLEKEWNARTGD